MNNKKPHIKEDDILFAFENLGLTNKRVVVHSSLKSFGHVIGGENTVINAVLKTFKTILMPAFSWESITKPPKGDYPKQNGCLYSFYNNWNKQLKPFLIENATIEKSMGVIPKKFLEIKGTVRSDHAWHSWAAYGNLKNELIKDHLWGTTNLPLERLSEIGGKLLLLGVNLSSCTAIHIAEEKAGRRSFIRWAVDRNGKVKRVRASGCAKGFNNLFPYCEHLFNTSYIGNCTVLVTDLKIFIDSITNIIKQNPSITKCSNNCIRCHDAILGGPIE